MLTRNERPSKVTRDPPRLYSLLSAPHMLPFHSRFSRPAAPPAPARPLSPYIITPPVPSIKPAAPRALVLSPGLSSVAEIAPRCSCRHYLQPAHMPAVLLRVDNQMALPCPIQLYTPTACPTCPSPSASSWLLQDSVAPMVPPG